MEVPQQYCHHTEQREVPRWCESKPVWSSILTLAKNGILTSWCGRSMLSRSQQFLTVAFLDKGAGIGGIFRPPTEVPWPGAQSPEHPGGNYAISSG